MTNRDQAHEIVDRVKHMDEGEEIEISDVEILHAPYTLTVTQPESGRLQSWIGISPKQNVEVSLPNGKRKSFTFDPTGPKHDASDELRKSLFKIHRRLYSAVN